MSLNGPTADVQAYSHHSADPSHRVAIVLLTHFYNQSIQSLYERLRDEAPEGYDVFVHINGKTDFNPASTKLPTASISISSDKSLMDLRYPTKCKGSGEKPWSIYGNNDLPLLHFWRNHRNYQFYWGIEYDVHYEGNWKRFFKYFSGSHADLLGADMHSAAETPSNRLDPCLCDPNGQEQDQSVIVRGFYPLFRLSQRAITAIDSTYQAGWCGHYELAWGTFVKNAGYDLEDFGGNGRYVKPENRNRFYFCMKQTYTKSPGTFVFRPAFSTIPRYENTLWHPVKPKGGYVNWFDDMHENGLLKSLLEKVKPLIWIVIIRLWFLLFWRRLA